MEDDIEAISKRYAKFSPVLDERMRRLWAGMESSVIGFGGVAAVSKATGLSRNTIVRGEKEIEEIKGKEVKIIGIRQPGGGRKKAIAIDPNIKDDLSKLIEPLTRGDPQSPLKWTCNSHSRGQINIAIIFIDSDSKKILCILYFKSGG